MFKNNIFELKIGTLFILIVIGSFKSQFKTNQPISNISKNKPVLFHPKSAFFAFTKK